MPLVQGKLYHQRVVATQVRAGPEHQRARSCYKMNRYLNLDQQIVLSSFILNWNEIADAMEKRSSHT
jgi:hypothetical protein